MRDLEGWQQLTCAEREAQIDARGRSYNGFDDASGVGVQMVATPRGISSARCRTSGPIDHQLGARDAR